MQKHKHSELIKEWADGAEIQAFDYCGWYTDINPTWRHDVEYRIKPEEPKPVVTYMNVYDLDRVGYMYNSIENARSSQANHITYRLKIVTYPNGTREFSVV